MNGKTRTAMRSSADSWELVYETAYSPDEELATAIAFAVATAKGIDPLDLDSTLYDVVDIDAVESPFEDSDSVDTGVTGRLEFEFAGSRVSVTSDGSIQVFEKAGI